MSEMSRNARRAMRAKIHRLTSAKSGNVDASSYGPEEVLNADVKTGMRPVSRRAYKKGGKVVAVSGADAKKNAGKKPRAGKKHLTVDALVNRNLKDANEAREGKKHVGALKTGGRAMKKGGGGIPDIYTSSRPTDDSGRPISDAELHLGYGDDTPPAPKPAPKPAAKPVMRGKPMSVADTLAGSRNMRKHGGKAWEGSAKDEAQDKKLAKKHGMSMESWEKSSMDKKHDKQHSAKGLKRGGFTSLDGEMQTQEKVSGRVAKQYGGSLGALEMNGGGRAKKKKSGTNINIVIATGKGQPQMDPNMPPAQGPQGIPVPMPAPQPQAGAPMPMPMPMPMPQAGGPGAGPQPMPRKAGGRTYRSYKDMDAGAGSGLGRLEKTEIQKHKK